MNMLSAVPACPSIIHQQKCYNHGKKYLNNNITIASSVGHDCCLTEEGQAGMSCPEFRAYQRFSTETCVHSHLSHLRSLLDKQKSRGFSYCCWWLAVDPGTVVEQGIFIAVSLSSF